MNKFLASYIETALWYSTDEQGIPLDDEKYSDAELADKTLARFEQDCKIFQAAFAELTSGLDDAVLRSIPDHVAHDFWLTRNRHGAGFWDGDYPEPLDATLTILAHSFGECHLYVGDDGKIHSS